MTGLGNALHEYLTKKKYHQGMWIITAIALVFILISGPGMMFILLGYSQISAALILPNTEADYMLPLSDREIKRKYVNVMVLKQIQIGIYMLLNVIFGSTLNMTTGYGKIWETRPVLMVLFLVMTFFGTFYNNLSLLQDNLIYSAETNLRDKGLARMCGFAGTLGFYGMLILYAFVLREYMLNTGGCLIWPEVAVTTVILLLLIGMTGFAGPWRIRDYRNLRMQVEEEKG